MIKILVVEDDLNLNHIICHFLKQHDFVAEGRTNGKEAINLLYQENFQLIISDIMMPEMDGYGLAAELRQASQTVPILFISARDDLPSKQRGYHLGIDDYMVKPIELDELLLRVQALLRRANICMEKKLVIGNMTLDTTATSIHINDKEISLTMREFQIIHKLLTSPDKTFTRVQLMDEFWELETDATLRAVDVYIAKLRDKLAGCDGFEIRTVRGLGYKAVLLPQ